VIKDSMILTFSKGIRNLLMLIFNMIIARLLTESVYGTYKQINLIMNLFISIGVLGIPTTISYFYSAYSNKKRERLLGNTTILLIILGTISAVIILCFKDDISLVLNNKDLLIYMNIIAIYILVMIVSSQLENLYIASQNAVLLGKVYIFYILVYFAGMIITILTTKNIYLLLIFMCLAEFARTIIMYILIKSKERLAISFDFNMMQTQIKFAIPLGIAALVQNLNMYIDNLFVSNAFSTEQYAAYANAATDIPFIGIITVSIATVVLPRMSKIYSETGSFDKVREIWSESFVKTALILHPIFWIAWFYSKGYIEIVFSSKYVVDSTPIFLIYLIRFPLLCTVYGNILIVLKSQKYLMQNTVLAISLNILLNFIFLKIWGIKGPAISSVLVYYITVFLMLRKIGKVADVKIRNLLEYGKILKVFLIPGVISYLIFKLSSNINISNSLKLILFGSIIYLLSIIVYQRLGLINFKLEKIINRS